MWHPGENALRGRDHTIHAAATGYVKYYRDPDLHPNRQYIGVAFNKEDVLPYPKKEPRRRRLGLVAVPRKAPAPSRGEVGPSGIPTKVVRRAGIWDLEELERKRWSNDKKRELREANEAAARANKNAEEKRRAKHLKKLAKKAAEAGETAAEAPGAVSVETAAAQAAAAGGETEPIPIVANSGVVGATTTTTTQPASQFAPEIVADARDPPAGSSAAATPADAEADGRTRRPTRRKLKLVHPGAYLQKRYLERRRTKVLHLDPRSYAYSESNAAIGRLATRTMYAAPWKIGGRRSRFRARRRKREDRMKTLATNRELVRRERAKEKIREEEALRKKLEKQRAKGLGKAARAEKAEGEEVEAPVAGKAGGEEVSGESIKGPVQPVQGDGPVAGEKPATSEKPVAGEKPVEGDKPVEG